MDSNYTPLVIAAGFASAAIFVLFNLMHVSIVLCMVAAIPLIYAGMRTSMEFGAISMALACCILIGFSPALLLLYAVLVVVPCLFLLANYWSGRNFLYTVVDIVLYVIFVAACLHVQFLDSGGIQGIMSDAFDQRQFDSIDPDIVEDLAWMMKKAGFLIIGMSVWSAVLIFYAICWMAAALLRQKQLFIQNFLRIRSEHPPLWVLYAAIIFALFSMLGEGSLAYLAKLNFVIILLPYCFSGAMYTPLRKWQGMQSGWSVWVYIVAFILTWPAVIFAALGVMKHIQAIVKK